VLEPLSAAKSGSIAQSGFIKAGLRTGGTGNAFVHRIHSFSIGILTDGLGYHGVLSDCFRPSAVTMVAYTVQTTCPTSLLGLGLVTKRMGMYAARMTAPRCAEINIIHQIAEDQHNYHLDDKK